MSSVERMSFKRRFRSPAALAIFGAFAAPEPLGAILLVCSAMWWWRSRGERSGDTAVSGEVVSAPPLCADPLNPASVTWALQLYAAAIRYGVGHRILKRRVPAMMASLASEGRLFALKASEWSLLLVSVALCGFLTLIF